MLSIRSPPQNGYQVVSSHPPALFSIYTIVSHVFQPIHHCVVHAELYQHCRHSRLTSSATLWEDSCQIPKQNPCGIKIDCVPPPLFGVLMAQSGTLTAVVFGGSESSWWFGVWRCSSTTDVSVTSPSVLYYSCSCLVWHSVFGDHLNLVHLLFVLFDPLIGRLLVNRRAFAQNVSFKVN